ncbi:uncharacterized protein BX663DRAFT_441023, partial [Cokeromyces recurvatus]|uniref:uncharacterized protein n=1 Tax=Cokeromyces recurvatus TaxID=90255 RepID=UPI00221E798F
SAIFEETFNIALGLINITIMDSACPSERIDEDIAWNRACDANYTLAERLSDFSLWRSKLVNDRAGLWHLMTNCPTGVEVGLAWLKQLCNRGASLQITPEGKEQYVSGAGVSAIGAIHDCSLSDCPCLDDNWCQCCQLNSNQCDTGGFLMSSITNYSAESFSPCSIDTVCKGFPALDTCLLDFEEQKDVSYQLNVCGNGIKEEDEECDTGGVETECCDPKTCKLKMNAICEDQNGECCYQCQFRPTSYMCRSASTPCDLAEYCAGHSSECPEDVYLQDGLLCGPNNLRCASGQCTSRDKQCLTRGFAINITQSCLTNNEECKLLCNSPSSDKSCFIFTDNFIDGTPCGFEGRCMGGVCENGDAISSSLIWLQRHKQVVVPVVIMISLILCVLLFLLCQSFGCIRQNKRKPASSITTIMRTPLIDDKKSSSSSSSSSSSKKHSEDDISLFSTTCTKSGYIKEKDFF